MGDSDAESDMGRGSDMGSDEGGGGFDPKEDLANMTEKQRKKWEKNIQKWKVFIDFLVRHVAIVTFRYNCFEREELTQFMIALEKAETLRSQTKLKKTEDPNITNYKTMKEASELLKQQNFLTEYNRIRRFLDIAGRMRGIATIAGGLYKALKKGKVKGLDRLKFLSDYWKGFCVRSYNYSELQFKGGKSEAFNEMERKYLVWPTAVRTAINLGQKFLKKSSDVTGIDMLSNDPRVQQQHMQACEFVVAAKMEEMLFQKVTQESNKFASSLGSTLLSSKPAGDRPTSSASSTTTKWNLPDLEDIDPELLKPIPDGGLLLELPDDPPKEKKGKKGKKGKGKKGGRGSSASSHKGGKKKKKKK